MMKFFAPTRRLVLGCADLFSTDAGLYHLQHVLQMYGH